MPALPTRSKKRYRRGSASPASSQRKLPRRRDRGLAPRHSPAQTTDRPNLHPRICPVGRAWSLVQTSMDAGYLWLTGATKAATGGHDPASVGFGRPSKPITRPMRSPNDERRNVAGSVDERDSGIGCHRRRRSGAV